MDQRGPRTVAICGLLLFVSAMVWTLRAQGPDLNDTSWQLVEFQSMDDATGTKKPSDPSQYTMRLGADGRISMQLNCNRATGTWKAQPGPDGTSGQFSLGPLATTRMRCPPPTLDEMIAAQATFVRSYLLKDGRLYLSLMADGGIQVWEESDRK